MIYCKGSFPEAEDIKGALPMTDKIPFAELTRSAVFHSKAIPGIKYDVFINHRGKDVKDTIASLVYHNLSNRKLKVFLDNKEMEHGEAIPHKIYQAISTASVHIAIFSENYAESVWCLSELSLAEESGAPIIPIFCGVQPNDLRMKRENEVGLYSAALHKLHQTVDSEYIEKWRATLHRVSYMFGFKFEGDCGMLLENIAASVRKHIKATRKFEGEKVVPHRHKRSRLELDSKSKAITGVGCQMGQSSHSLQVSSETVVSDLLSKVEPGKRIWQI
ncbi:hypothetical protein SUGI_0061710 [Cryptomeria japonica]|nr:hypothetical protein SUGI_0061710 [Cryptomeria japonica]